MITAMIATGISVAISRICRIGICLFLEVPVPVRVMPSSVFLPSLQNISRPQLSLIIQTASRCQSLKVTKRKALRHFVIMFVLNLLSERNRFQ